MDFGNLTAKELFDNPDTAAVIKELAPQLLKYPIKLLGKKKCGEIFDKVVATGIGPSNSKGSVSAHKQDTRKPIPSKQISPASVLFQNPYTARLPVPHRCRASERWNPTIE